MFIRSIFKSSDDRTVLLKKNIVGSFFIKGWSCIVQFLLIPITLDCLSPYEYGVWLTVSSVLIWIDSFDIGLGNGLRNKLAEALACRDYERGRRLVSTTFVMLIIIIIPLLLVFSLVIYYIDCYRLFNVERYLVPNLRELLMISLFAVGTTFIFKFIGNIYLGLQLPAINNLLVVLGQTLTLVGVCGTALVKNHSIINVTIIYTVSPLIIYILSYPVTFIKYRYLRPSLRLFERKEMCSLFTLGIGFFFVQLAGLVIFASSNLLISNLFSPSEVTPYQISYKYFSIVLLLFTLIAAPLWSATTDAYIKNDWIWINKTMGRMQNVVITFSVILFVMVIASKYIYLFWVGAEIKISLILSILMSIYMFVLMYSTYYSNILFGIGKIRLITIITIIEALLYIPLAMGLSKFIGLYGVVVALIAVNLICMISNRIQFNKLSKGVAVGIWNK